MWNWPFRSNSGVWNSQRSSKTLAVWNIGNSLTLPVCPNSRGFRPLNRIVEFEYYTCHPLGTLYTMIHHHHFRWIILIWAIILGFAIPHGRSSHRTVTNCEWWTCFPACGCCLSILRELKASLPSSRTATLPSDWPASLTCHWPASATCPKCKAFNLGQRSSRVSMNEADMSFWRALHWFHRRYKYFKLESIEKNRTIAYKIAPSPTKLHQWRLGIMAKTWLGRQF